MKVGVPKEIMPGETRVALIPETVKRLTDKKLEVLVENGAGTAAGFPDEAYREVGATLVERHGAVLGESDLILKVQRPATAKDGVADEVTQLCRASIAGYKVPKEVRFVRPDELPRSTTGKIQRHELEKRLAPAEKRPS